MNSGAVTPISWRDEQVSRIVLGTVQLGMDYGVANAQGQPDFQKAVRVIEAAWEGGIRHFDTAQAYGESESVLGRAFRELGISGEVHVASKLAPGLDPSDGAAVQRSVERTLEQLGVPSLWCMMLHRAAWLDVWDDELGGVLKRCKNEGLIRHLGASANSPAEAERCVAHPDVEILQTACNAWDRRIIRLGVLARAQQTGRLCCVRSIYLKGLLTLSPEDVAARMGFAGEASARWHAVANGFGISPIEMAVRFAVGLDAPLVVGAEAPEQIAETVRIAAKGPLDARVIDAISAALDPILNDTILTPGAWERLDGVRLNPGQ